MSLKERFLMFCCFLQQTSTDPKPGKCVQVPLVAGHFLRGRSRGSGQRDISQGCGSLVLLARSRISGPAAGDEARVESYVCSFISKQPENSITSSSKQANGQSTHLLLTLHNPTLFAGVSCINDAGLCFCGVYLTQGNKVV